MTTTKTQNTLGLNITPVAYRWMRHHGYGWQYSKRVPRIKYKLGELKMKNFPNIQIEGLYSQEQVQNILNRVLIARNMLKSGTIGLALLQLEGLLHDAN